MIRPERHALALALALLAIGARAALPDDVARGIAAAAARGDATARLLAAEMILRGELAGDATAARGALESAAAAGQGHAAFVLGVLAFQGRPAERATALAWWRAAANAGDADAQYDLGLLLVEDDPREAERLWEAAAAQRHTLACYALGTRRAATDPDHARAWLECAAREAYAPAQFNLARLYERGLGGPPDLGRARELYAAAAGAFPPAAEALAALPAPAPAPVLTVHDAAWLLTQPADGYLVQVATGASEAALRDTLARAGVTGAVACVLERPTSRQPWSAMLGVFPDYVAANAALATLPTALRDKAPWIRRLGPLLQTLRDSGAAADAAR